MVKKWIKRLSVSLLIVIPLVYFFFCYSRIDTEALAANPMNFQSMEGGRWLTESCAKIDAELKRDIVAWFDQNRHGWTPSIVTYVPRHSFSGERLNANLVSELLIVNYGRTESTTGWFQVTKRLGQDDRRFWNRMVKSMVPAP